ncbi:MAG: Lrp/AsnC family transcriptional regulator [Promethearchaeota archaeon]
MDYNQILGIDNTDKKIIELLQENPEITHSEIAKKVNKSQPAVGARIIKLKRKFLLSEQMGAVMNEIPIKYAKVELQAKNVKDLWIKFSRCPNIINAFKITGKYNILVEVVAPSVQMIDKFIDNCLRKDPSVMDVQTTYIIRSLHPHILPLSFNIDQFATVGCNIDCRKPITKDNLQYILNKGEK